MASLALLLGERGGDECDWRGERRLAVKSGEVAGESEASVDDDSSPTSYDDGAEFEEGAGERELSAAAQQMGAKL